MERDSSAIIVRLPAALHRRLKSVAARTGVSLNKTCLDLLSGNLAGHNRNNDSSLENFSSEHDLPLAGIGSLAVEVRDHYRDKIEAVVLFGSAARQKLTAGSDIDLLIVLNKEVSFDRDCYSEWQWPKLADRDVSPLFVHMPDTAFEVRGVWLEIAIDGIVLYDRSFAVSRYLSNVRELIAAGKFRRQIAHGHPYWVPADRESKKEV